MTVKEAYEIGKKQLQAAGIREFEIDAFYLLEYVTGITRAKFYVDYEKKLADGQVKRYKEILAKRAKRIPLQHLTGEQEFMGLSFSVNEDVLIPRQDTEVLVEAALEIIWNQASMAELFINRSEKGKQKVGWQQRVGAQEQVFSFLDMCTGSGCILLSILKHSYGKMLQAYAKKSEIAQPNKCNNVLPRECPAIFTKIEGTGVDVSENALKVAKKNVNRIFPELASGGFEDEIGITLLQSDLFNKVFGKFHLIVSNPPYIGTFEFGQLAEEVRCHEPRVALVGGDDGLWYYRRIIKESKEYLLPGGHLLLEIGATGGREVSDLMRYHGYKKVKITKDLTGFDRIVQGQYHSLS